MTDRNEPVSAQTDVVAKRRIFISTGEVSGDLQGALLIQALTRQAAERQISLEVLALGGQRMAAAGAELLGDTTGIGSVGIFEALPFLLPTLAMQRRARKALDQVLPDIVILIDYMNPNLMMGHYFQTHHPQIPVIYYIAPQQWVWAFSTNDSQKLVAYSDQMLAIFKPEAEYFQSFGAEVTWVGHPLVDKFPIPANPQVARQALGLSATAQIVTLLPASRQQEIKYLLPVIFKAAQLLQQQLPQIQFLVPVSSESFRPILERNIVNYGLQAQVISDQPEVAIAAADLCITKSGTANLEIALMGVPQVVTYRLSPISAWIAQYLLKFDIPFVSPVNLVENQPVVPELIQWQATPEAIVAQALELLNNPAARRKMLEGYAGMRLALGEPGACDRAARLILDRLELSLSESS